MLSSNDAKTIAIACFDLGEFCRFHGFGKQVIEKEGAKELIMEHAKSLDPNIKEYALIAL